MTEKAEKEIKSEESPSKNDSETDSIQYIDYDLKIRCAKTRDGKTKFCTIQDISIEAPSKEPTPLPVAEASLEETSFAAAPRSFEEAEDAKCSLCEALANALTEQTRSNTASRKMTSSVGRRYTSRV